MKKQVNSWSEDHALTVFRGLENHVFPHIGERPISEIGTREMLSVLRRLEAAGKHEAAQRARQRCEAVFRYGIITGICDHNPAIDLKGALTSPKKEKRAALSPPELPEFLEKLEHYDGHILTRLALYLILYTFVRTSELRYSEWSEFETGSDHPVWRIPAQRMKMKKEHLVPLSTQALDVLDKIASISGGGRLVFPGQNNPAGPMSENTLLYALYRMGYHSRATTHGFRSTASTVLNESGKWHPDSIERQLAHLEGNKVRAAYDRSEHLQERRRMMQWWADYLDSAAAKEQKEFEKKHKIWEAGISY